MINKESAVKDLEFKYPLLYSCIQSVNEYIYKDPFLPGAPIKNKKLYQKIVSNLQTSRQLFEQVVDQSVFMTDTHQSIREVFIIWYTIFKTYISETQLGQDLHVFSNKTLDEIILSLGYPYASSIKSNGNKIAFILSLIQFYKFKGTPGVIAEVLPFVGINNLSIIEWWLEENTNAFISGALIARGKFIQNVGYTKNIQKVDQDLIIEFDAFVNPDPYWRQTQREILIATRDNDITLPSITHQISLVHTEELFKLIPILAVLNRLAQEDYESAVKSRHIIIPELEQTVCISTLFIAINYVTQLIDIPKGAKKFTSVYGTTTTSLSSWTNALIGNDAIVITTDTFTTYSCIKDLSGITITNTNIDTYWEEQIITNQLLVYQIPDNIYADYITELYKVVELFEVFSAPPTDKTQQELKTKQIQETFCCSTDNFFIKKNNYSELLNKANPNFKQNIDEYISATTQQDRNEHEHTVLELMLRILDGYLVETVFENKIDYEFTISSIVLKADQFKHITKILDFFKPLRVFIRGLVTILNITDVIGDCEFVVDEITNMHIQQFLQSKFPVWTPCKFGFLHCENCSTFATLGNPTIGCPFASLQDYEIDFLSTCVIEHHTESIAVNSEEGYAFGFDGSTNSGTFGDLFDPEIGALWYAVPDAQFNEDCECEIKNNFNEVVFVNDEFDMHFKDTYLYLEHVKIGDKCVSIPVNYSVDAEVLNDKLSESINEQPTDDYIVKDKLFNNTTSNNAVVEQVIYNDELQIVIYKPEK